MPERPPPWVTATTVAGIVVVAAVYAWSVRDGRASARRLEARQLEVLDAQRQLLEAQARAVEEGRLMLTEEGLRRRLEEGS